MADNAEGVTDEFSDDRGSLCWVVETLAECGVEEIVGARFRFGCFGCSDRRSEDANSESNPKSGLFGV